MIRDISIFDIAIDQIEPHPQNPRKDLGDLTELCESIKANGIMQNLTVVPLDDQYTRFRCVIGHRRLAAAKKVGLHSVPATIADGMDEKEQIAVMVAENMQRADLTIPEQAQAVQMMLDLGEDFESIAGRTGLSESTVRRRARIAKYDPKTVNKALKQGATLFDFETLEKIKDPKRREEALKMAGTQSFAAAVRNAVEDEKREAFMNDAVQYFEKFAEETESYQGIWCAAIRDEATLKERGLDTPDGRFEFMRKYPDDAKFYYRKAYSGFEIYYTSESEDAAKTERMKEVEKQRTHEERIRSEGELYIERQIFWMMGAADDGRIVVNDELVKMIAERIEYGCGGYTARKFAEDTLKKAKAYGHGESMSSDLMKIVLYVYAIYGNHYGNGWTQANGELSDDKKRMNALMAAWGYEMRPDEIEYCEHKSKCFR